MAGWWPLSGILTVVDSSHPSFRPYVHPSIFVSSFFLFSTLLSSIFKFFFSRYLLKCYDCNNTHLYLYYLHYLYSVDTLGSFGDDGEVDGVWCLLNYLDKLVAPGFQNTV